MLHDAILFHNVADLLPLPGVGGLLLSRYPLAVANALGDEANSMGRSRAKRALGCELRFTTAAPSFTVLLTALEEDVALAVYHGDLLHSRHMLRAGQLTQLHIATSDIYQQVDTARLPHGRFAQNIWRLQAGYAGCLVYHGLDTFGYGHRPPKAGEQPAVKWAAYGSSITCGHSAVLYSSSYVHMAATLLGWDALNKGLSGSCFCEDFIGGHLATLPVDVLSLELGVNLLRYEPERFRQQVARLLGDVAASGAQHIFVIDMFPNRGTIATPLATNYYEKYTTFKTIVREETQKIADPRFHSLHGEAILKDLSYLTTDLLHPSDMGQALMGQNLAEEMRKRI